MEKDGYRMPRRHASYIFIISRRDSNAYQTHMQNYAYIYRRAAFMEKRHKIYEIEDTAISVYFWLMRFDA